MHIYVFKFKLALHFSMLIIKLDSSIYIVVLCCNCDRNCKQGLIRIIINNEIVCFEILNTVCLENAQCLVYTILFQSIAIQGNSIELLFIGLLWYSLVYLTLACSRLAHLFQSSSLGSSHAARRFVITHKRKCIPINLLA